MSTTLEKPLQRLHARAAKRRSWPPQIQKYHLQWAAIFKKYGWANRPESEKRDLRHSILEDLFGDANFALSRANNAQWDCVYLALEFLLENGIAVWSKETAKIAVENGLCKRYIWNIEHAGYDLDCVADYGAPEEYIAAVALGKFGVRNWRALDSYSLWQLFITIKTRVKKAGARGASLHKNADNEPF